MSSEINPLVSIVIITYNSAKYVLETLESAKGQTYQNIELIVSDDCSTDNTVEICQKWLEANKDRFVRTELLTVEKNTGIAPNCNRGARNSKGEWVKLIAGDDALEKNGIGLLLNFVKHNTEAKFIHGKVAEYQEYFKQENFIKILGDKSLPINRVDTPKKQFEVLLRQNTVYVASSMVKRELYELLDYYDERFPFFEDRPFLLKVLKNNFKLYFMDEVISKYRRSYSSIQKNANTNALFLKSKEDYFRTILKAYYPNFEYNLICIDLRLSILAKRYNRSINCVFCQLKLFNCFFLRIITNRKLSKL